MRFRKQDYIACKGTKKSVPVMGGEKKKEVAYTLCSLKILRRMGARERVACDRGDLRDNREDKSKFEKRERTLGEEKEWKEWI